MIYRNYGFCIGAIIVSGWISCLTLYEKTNSSISCTVESRATFHVRFKRLYAVGLSPLARTGSVVGIFESLPLIVVPKKIASHEAAFFDVTWQQSVLTTTVSYSCRIVRVMERDKERKRAYLCPF